MRRIFGSLLAIALVLGSAAVATAQVPRLSIDDDTWLQLRFLGQLQFEAAERMAGEDSDRWGYDFFTRRARIMGTGSVHRNVRFFFSTDVPNTGRRGASNEMVWNDGFVDVQIAPAFNIAMGRILAPFSPDVRGSAATLLGIDYNLNLIKTPTLVSRAFWRDDGVEVRGMAGDGLFEYRGGVFKGMRTPANNQLRTTGMVMVNLGAAQPGWFYNPNSLGALEILSFGVGLDRIPDSTAGVEHSLAWNLFAVVEQPLGAGRLNAMASYFDWDGPAWVGGFEGNTMGIQVGYLLPPGAMEGRWQPVLRLQRQDNPGADFTLNTVNLGINYFLKGHAINWKLDLAINDRQVAGESANAVRFQTQVLF
jgi:hypothetical protein